jgi:hypothetical protein
MYDDWGRYLWGVAVAAFMVAVRDVRKETLPLNAARDIMEAIKHDLHLYWTKEIHPRIDLAQELHGDERSTADEAALIRVLKVSWALGAETPDDVKMVAVVNTLYPNALERYRLTPAEAQDVYQLLRERHNIDLVSPEACRKRFARFWERVRRQNTSHIWEFADAIRKIPKE